jgi:hypothetical protein
VLVCSYDLWFLEIYMLSKGHYVSIMVQSYNIVRKLAEFSHFTLLRTINSTPAFRDASTLLAELQKYFEDRRHKVENVIFQL